LPCHVCLVVRRQVTRHVPAWHVLDGDLRDGCLTAKLTRQHACRRSMAMSPDLPSWSVRGHCGDYPSQADTSSAGLGIIACPTLHGLGRLLAGCRQLLRSSASCAGCSQASVKHGVCAMPYGPIVEAPRTLVRFHKRCATWTGLEVGFPTPARYQAVAV